MESLCQRSFQPLFLVSGCDTISYSEPVKRSFKLCSKKKEKKMGDRRAVCGLFGRICGKIALFLGNMYKYVKYICINKNLFVSLRPNNYFYMRMCAE